MNEGITLVINQPTFLPWLGYFDLINKADSFIALNTVQFSRQSWQQRNRIKTPNGVVWLTVPVQRSFGEKILDVKINYSTDWQYKHLKTIEQSYKKTPFFEKVFPMLEEIYNTSPKFLVDLNVLIIKEVCTYLNIKTALVCAHEIPIEKHEKVPYVLDLCDYMHTKTYLNGAAGKKLYDPKDFEERKINLVFHDYHHPVYNQLHGEFVPYLSIVDALCNCGSSVRDFFETSAAPSL